MKLFAAASLLVLMAQPSGACVRQFSGPGRQLAYSVAVGPDGSIAIAGAMEGSADFGGGVLVSAGDRDFFVARYDSQCRHLWSKRFGSAGEELFVDVRFDQAGNLLLAGNMTGSADFGGGLLQSRGDYDVVLVKLAADGSHIWSKRFGDSAYQIVNQIALDPMGNIVLVGTFRGALDFGLGSPTGGIYVAKLDGSGAPLFSRGFGTQDSGTQLRSVAVDRSGHIAVAGITSASLSLGGPVLPIPQGPFGYPTVLAKFSPQGVYEWSHEYPVLGGETVAFGPDGALFLTLRLLGNGSVDVGGQTFQGEGTVLTRLDESGNHEWAKRFGPDVLPASGSPSLVVDGAGILNWAATVRTTADFGGGPRTSHGTYDIAMVRLNGRNGEHLSSTLHGDKRPQFVASVAVASSGEVVMAGAFSGSVNFGASTLFDSDGSGSTQGTEQTAEDVFLVRYDPASQTCCSNDPPPPPNVPALGFTGKALMVLMISLTGAWTLRGAQR